MKDKNFSGKKIWQDFALIICYDLLSGRITPAWDGWGTTAGTLSPKTHLTAQVCPCPLSKGLLSRLRQQSSNPAGHWDVLLRTRRIRRDRV